LKYKLMSAVACASIMFATPANAEVDNVSAYEKTQSTACAEAKSMARSRSYVIKGFGPCQCSPHRASDGTILGYDCNVDVYFERKN
jgi:hypothetical protein